MRVLKSKTVKIIWTFSVAISFLITVIFLTDYYVKSEVPVAMAGLSVSTDLWDKGYVSYEGTWVLEGEKIWAPLQTSTATCNLKDRVCIQSTASVSDNTLLVNQDTYEISNWDDHIIVYKDSALCMDSIYTINRDTKQVSGIRIPNEGKEKICSASNKELRSRLTNGFDVYWDMQKEVRPIFINYLALFLALVWIVFRIRKIIKLNENEKTKTE